MKISIYQVDAFTSRLFGGNPAAVCPLDKWLSDSLLQSIAMENNQSETAFFVKNGPGFHLRWFTPVAEVDLCGHATLATSYVIFNELKHPADRITFDSKSGKLFVRKENNSLTLDFPADSPAKVPPVPSIVSALGGITPVEMYKGRRDFMALFETEEQITQMNPDFRKLNETGIEGLIVTARGKTVDFVSRYFAPNCGIDEDPVTGSAHTTLAPYWSARLGKTEFTALQLSKRRGELKCKLLGNRVEISGEARLYLKGEIEVHES